MNLSQFSLLTASRWKSNFLLLSCPFLQVIAVNGTFPGPTLNVTTNYNVVVNVMNKLDEDLLITW